MAITAHEIAQWRLAAQQIAHRPATTPDAVVGRLLALQAQDYSGALWAIGLRLAHATQADVENAIAGRRIVRTWPLRGTLHFVAATDVRWMLDLIAPRIRAADSARRRQLGLDDATLARSRELVIDGLAGGKQLARPALLGVLEAGQVSTAGQRGYHILGHLAQSSVICFGPRQGKQETFVLLDDWVPHAPRLARDEALAALALRYFRGHGPATLTDFVWWSGQTVADARAGLAQAQAQLVAVEAEGDTYWMAPELEAVSRPAPSVDLLPSFDEYLLGYRERKAVLDLRHAEQIAPGRNGVFRPMIVLDGRVAGTWKRTLKKQTALLEATPFVALNQAGMVAYRAAAQRYARFIGLDVQAA